MISEQDRRALLAVVLCFAVYIAWMALFPPPAPRLSQTPRRPSISLSHRRHNPPGEKSTLQTAHARTAAEADYHATPPACAYV